MRSFGVDRRLGAARCCITGLRARIAEMPGPGRLTQGQSRVIVFPLKFFQNQNR